MEGYLWVYGWVDTSGRWVCQVAKIGITLKGNSVLEGRLLRVGIELLGQLKKKAKVVVDHI